MRQKLIIFWKKCRSHALVKWAAKLWLVFISLSILFPLPKIPDYSKIIKDSKGKVLHVFLTKDDKVRLEIPLEKISPLLRKTLLQKEDQYFYYHFGINPIAVVRALIGNIWKGKISSGASTITMQTARMLERRPRTYKSKIIEMFRALQLEWYYSKDEIFQLYCNLLPYGGNVEGIQSAAFVYLNKSADLLSLAEITSLSVIPNNPNFLYPGKNNAGIIKERNIWLHRFRLQKIFPASELQNALQEPFDVQRLALPHDMPHLSYRLKNTKENEIITTIDADKQIKIERIVKEYIRGLKLLNINNAAVLVIDNSTHEVISYVGSADFFNEYDDGQVDGVQAIRQPGSTLKPLLYALAIDKGLLTPKKIIEDVPINYDGYAPENYDKNYYGNVSMEFSLGQSLNVPAVKTLKEVEVKFMIEKLIACNFYQIKKDKNKLGLSLCLGGCGANLQELTTLFSCFAHNGNYNEIKFIKGEKSKTSKAIFSASAAFMITEILSKIQRPDFPIDWKSTEHLPRIAWKTGTSYGRKDAWSIGYNQKYTVGVWVGNFSGAGIPELNGAGTATPLLFSIFNTINYNDDLAWFNKPKNCALRTVCAESGMPCSDKCTQRISDYFIPLVSKNEICNLEKEIQVDAQEQISYCLYCLPSAGYKNKFYKNYTAAIQQYFTVQHIPYEKIPPHNPACNHIASGARLQIISPKYYQSYIIDKQAPQPLELQCAASADVKYVIWYVNNTFYKKALKDEKVFFTPDQGKNIIKCMDDKGQNASVQIEVEIME